jgi:hypothetical protein
MLTGFNILRAGAFLVVENTFASDSMKERKGRDSPLTMIDCFYFVATTISTVGSHPSAHPPAKFPRRLPHEYTAASHYGNAELRRRGKFCTGCV